MAGEDKSLHGSAGDDFHQWYPEYMEAGLLAKQLEDHNEKLKSTLDPSVYSSRAKKIEFIRNLAKEKTAYYIGRRLAIMSHS
jgi:hypothetical protein